MGSSFTTWLPYHQFLLINSKKHMVSSNGPITPFVSTDESIDDTTSIWTLLSHTDIYIMVMGLLILAGLGTFFCSLFWY